MKKITYLILVMLLILPGKQILAQLYPVDITDKAMNASLIVEGKVVSQQSFWNETQTMIFTSNTITLYKSFKGQAPATTIEVLTQGGVVGTKGVEVSDLGQLTVGDKGIFFLYANTIGLKSPVSGKSLYDIYASDQGILRYSIAGNQAYCPFEKYDGITSSLYSKLEALTGKQPVIIDARYNVEQEIAAGNSHGQQRLQATITSTSPAVVNAGAILDPANNILTIYGSGFGNSPTGNHYLLFKDGNTDVSAPTYVVDNNSPYLVSWENTVIKVQVPARAANGRFGIYFGPGDTAFAPLPLKVRFSVLNASFASETHAQEPRLSALNGAGGYSIKYSTSTAGNGANLTNSPVYNTFRRALITWKETTGVNFAEAGNSTIQLVNPYDGQNIIMLDNSNTGTSVLAAGVLATTISGFDICNLGLNAIGHKTGFDVVIRNQGVSAGNIGFENGPCPPAFVANGLIDMETVLLHELGHALNLAHVNDPQEVPNAPFGFVNYVNPAGVMHPIINGWASRRSLDESAYSGGLYTTTPRGILFGLCLALTEMVRLPTLVPANDNCPIVFPTAYTTQGTAYNMDLVHATSNNAVDPQYTAATCLKPISVTNNVYQVIRTSYNGTLDIVISNYATSPTGLATAACDSNQGVKLTLYDVASCPNGQAFPAPFKCLTFTGNSDLPDLTGLGAKKTYLMFFEGIRNTKATFTVKLAGTALSNSKLSLTGKNINRKTNKLQITIAEATDVKSVMVERSADGINFEKIGQLSSGANSFDGSYDYTDASALNELNYYRLETTDFAGNVEYSAIISLKVTDEADISFQPNPFHDFVNVISRETSSTLTVVISDAFSRKIVQTTFNGSTQLSTSSLSQGTYLVSVYDAAGQLLVTKKMLKD